MAAFEVRQQVLEFAATFPSPAVREAVAYAQAGRLTWEQVYDLFHRSLSTALEEVAR